MTLDKKLLSTCTQKAERLFEQEHALEQAKSDYHYAIRRLHLAGGSYREIAAALGMSHQRVSQIVNSDSRNWLRRWMNPESEEVRLACSFCKRPSHKVQKLVAGPQVYICDGCIQGAESTLDNGASAKKTTAFQLITNSIKRCSFCAKKCDKQRKLVGNLNERICNQCLVMAREFAEQG